MAKRESVCSATPVGEPSEPATQMILPVVRVAEQWLVAREVADARSLVSFRHRQGGWLAAVRPCQNPRVRSTVVARLATIEYLKSAIDVHADAIMQRAIFQRFLQDTTVGWLTGAPQRGWPVSTGGAQPFRFSAFTPLMCIALGNLLCLLSDMRAGRPADHRRPVIEFALRAMRQQKGLVLGDLLAAQVLAEAVSDLKPVFRDALSAASRRRLIDFLLPGRRRARMASAARLDRWFENSLLMRARRISALNALLDVQAKWDGRAIGPALQAAVSAPEGDNVRRWLAWRIGQRLRPGGAACRPPLSTLMQCLRRRRGPAVWAFAAQCVLEVITEIPPAEAEPFLQRFCLPGGTSVLARLCGVLTRRAVNEAPRETDGPSAAIWDRWNRVESRLLWTAIQSGQAGQLFVGQCLKKLVRPLRNWPLDWISVRVPELRLGRLSREWFQATLGILPGEASGRGALLAKLQKDLAELHPDMRRILNAQRALWAAQAQCRLSGGSA